MLPNNPIKKIKISLKVNSSDQLAVNATAQVYEFIYGIGTYGLCPLEKALDSKSSGDEIRLRVNGDNWSELFGHLPLPYLNISSKKQVLEFVIQIISMAPVNDREVIQALASLTECGGGCGCGCGGH